MKTGSIVRFTEMSLALILLLSTGYKAFAQDSLSLKECIFFTLQHNANSTIYKNDVAVAHEKIRQSKAALLPTVSATTTLDYNPKLLVNIIPGGGPFGAEDTKFSTGTKYASGGYIEAEQVLLNRAYRLDVKSSNLEKEIAELNAIKENETLIYNTAVAYYEALVQQEKIRLSRESEKRELSLQQIVKLQYDQGVVKINEYHRAVVNLKNTQSELALHQTNHEQALRKLKFAMGMNLQMPVRIIDVVNEDEQVAIPSEGDFNPAFLTTFKVDEYTLRNKQINVMKKKAAYLPTLTTTGKYGAVGYSDATVRQAYQRFFDYGVITAKLSIPIFSGFKKNSELAESKLSAENQRLTQQVNVENYTLDYQNSRTALYSFYTSLKENKETLTLAKTVLESSTLEYKTGTITYSALLADSYSYNEAHSNYITSLIDYQNARLDYEKAKGTLSDYLNIKK